VFGVSYSLYPILQAAGFRPRMTPTSPTRCCSSAVESSVVNSKAKTSDQISKLRSEWSRCGELKNKNRETVFGLDR
jgi:hypothetical protein